MANNWQEISQLIRGRAFTVERIRLEDGDIRIEAPFELPPLARLSADDQVFVAAFVRSHGSIKQMESFFGISYPTVKNRLNRISEQLEFVEITPGVDRAGILTLLEAGEISAAEAIERMKGEKEEE